MTLRLLAPLVFLLGLGASAFASAAEVAAPSLDDDATLGAKLDAYIECSNRHSNMAFNSRDRYLSWIRSAEQGPTGREDIVYGLYTLYDPADCYEAIEKAAAQPPDLPKLEQAAAQYAGALRHLKRVTDEAHDYYDLEDYRDDGFAKGKQMHAGLMQAFAAFETASDALTANVDEYKDGLVERDLARLKADPDHQRDYAARLLLFRARQMVDLGAVAQDSLDVDAFQASVSAYEEAYRNATKYENAVGGEEELPSTVLSSARELLKTGKALVRRARDGFRYDAGEQMFLDSSPEMVEGHPAKLVKEFNQLVDWSNSMLR
ncbi:MAG TPA: YiiG family protein [Xanthomonadales bacterium]|nr:YiiG family protein [Xanthomonadales bacterium]